MKLGLQKSEILKFGQHLNLNAQTSVLFQLKSKYGNFYLPFTLKRRKMLQANWAGRVRLNFIIRIGDSSNLESHKRLPLFLILAILFGRSH